MNRRAATFGRHAVLLVGAVAVVVPFLWMFTTSLQTRAETYTSTSVLPTSWHWENYAHAWAAAPFGRYYLNSLVMAVGIVAGHLVLDALAAYAFARLRFPLRDQLFVVLLAMLLVPTFVTVIPAYSLVAGFGWIDTYAGLIVPRLADVFGIILLRQYFAGIPQELDDAARIDGCSRAGTFFRIMVPLSMPAFATLAIFSFLFAWNDFLWPLLVTNSDEMRTVQIGMASFEGRYGTTWNYLMAGTVMATVPAIAVFMVFQRLLVRGIAMTGLKD